MCKLLLVCYFCCYFTVGQSQALCNCSMVCCHQISFVLVNRANHFQDLRNQTHPNAVPVHFSLNPIFAANAKKKQLAFKMKKQKDNIS